MAERGEFELSVPISAQSDYKKLAGFAAPTRIVGIARGSNAGSACPVGNIPKGTFVRGKCANFHLGLADTAIAWRRDLRELVHRFATLSLQF